METFPNPSAPRISGIIISANAIIIYGIAASSLPLVCS